MNATRLSAVLCLGLLAALAAACGAPAPSESIDEPIPRGKLDDFRSTIGYEYELTATASVTLAGDDAALEGEARAARAAELAQSEVDRITRAVNSALDAIWSKDDKLQRGAALTLRKGTFSAADMTVTADDANTFTFTYKGQLAGRTDLLSKLPLETRDGRRVLDVDLGGDRTLELTFKQVDETPDAYPRYRELFEGGLDVTVHVGGDYNEERYDLSKAREIFDKLAGELGFSKPEGVASFEDLALDSGPFTKTLRVDGEEVAVRVKLIHPDMAEDDALDTLVDAYKEQVKTADVVYYTGHAGLDASYSGVVVHYNPRVALKAADFRNLELPDKYQLFAFVGCETYAHYADQIYHHPRKTTANLDVITAVNYTRLSRSGQHFISFLEGLTAADGAGQWAPRSYGQLLSPMNIESRTWVEIFGVHGLEDNPRLSPLARVETLGQSCSRASDCPGVDSRCVRLSGSDSSVCGVACADQSACPEGYSCRRINTSWWNGPGKLSQCLPTQ
ncbi:MAG: hypothetical protein KC503_16885 [Myxococcales bacterium]|nr:hypothetical protein [Myxococcales bacterium]